MVRRFIKQQQIGTANQRLSEVKAHTPAAGKVAHRSFKLFVAETEPVEQAGRTRADGPGVDGVQLTVYRRDGMTVITFVGRVQIRLQLAEFAIAINNIVNSRLRKRRRFLVNPGQLPAAGEGHRAAVGANLVFQKRKQRGFTAAVFTHQADFLPWVDGSGGVVQQDAYAATNL